MKTVTETTAAMIHGRMQTTTAERPPLRDARDTRDPSMPL
jgi:hypothetical protein